MVGQLHPNLIAAESDSLFRFGLSFKYIANPFTAR